MPEFGSLCGRCRHRSSDRDFDLKVFECLDGTQQSDTTAGRNALLHGCAGGVERVVHSILLLFDLDFGCAADADHRDAARKLGQPFLASTIVIGGRLLDLRLDLANARFDVLLLTGAVDDCGRFLVDAHPLGAA